MPTNLPNSKNASVNLHDFSMIPGREVPRSTFLMQHTLKTTFDGGYLVPIYWREILPGDDFTLNLTAFIRLTTPLFPAMDNLHFETFFFFVPYRILWTNWPKMHGEQDNPGDSISYTTPQIVSKAGGYDPNSLYDYFGLPTAGQMTGANTYSHSALPLRAYAKIYDDWFRDENLQNSILPSKGDGPDLYTAYTLLRRGKRKDYFTGALPWPQKGNTAVSLPLGTSAPVNLTATLGGTQSIRDSTTHNLVGATGLSSNAGGVFIQAAGATGVVLDPAGTLYADLTTATAATINQLRQAEQIQIVLERDARGGTRYTEQILSHFKVRSPDARLQRPEYLGGGHAPITFTPVPQTSATGLTGGSAPVGTLAAAAASNVRGHGFKQAFTEHGIVIGLGNVRADLTYQQGVQRFWNKTTRYDYYLPAFAQLGEQAILQREIYALGTAADTTVFGYQERWAEERYHPSMITGLFRSTSTGTIDPWHYAQNFGSAPTLNTTFIQETPPIDRNLAVGSAANGKQFYFDGFYNVRATRPLPMFSVPSLATRF